MVQLGTAQIVSALSAGFHLEAVQEGFPAQAQGGARARGKFIALLLLSFLRGTPGFLHVILLVGVEAVLGVLDGGGAGQGHGPVEGVLYGEIVLEGVVGVVPRLAGQ